MAGVVWFHSTYVHISLRRTGFNSPYPVRVLPITPAVVLHSTHRSSRTMVAAEGSMTGAD